MREYLSDFVSTQNNGMRNANGTGYVIIKATNNPDREKYIKNCILKGCITIVLENGGFIENAPVLKHIWNDIVFPEVGTKFGSQVMWNNIPKSNVVVVTGIITKNNEITNRNENEFVLARTFVNPDTNNVTNLEISGNADEGCINIAIDGGNNKSNMNIILSNKDKTAALNVILKGSFNVDSSGTITISSANNVQVKSKKLINFGKGKEALLLGNTTKQNLITEQDALTALIEAIKVAPVVAGDGGASFKSAIVSAISSIQRGDYSNILSKLTNTD